MSGISTTDGDSIEALPVASSVSAGDLVPVVQGGVTKQADVSLIIGSVGTLQTVTNAGNTTTNSITAANLTGTNSGDETTATIKTKLGFADVSNDGYLTTLDWNTFNAKQAALGFTPENSANKDATGGYAGLTLFKINFKNAANTFISFFTNSNTAARTYTFQDRNGTISDDADLALKSPIASPTFTGTVTTPAIIVSSETASRVAIIDASKNVKSADTATYPSLTELAYVKGVTSAVQTQLNTKISASSTDTLTNKRITPRVYSSANNASLTPEKDTYDIFRLTAMSANTTINNPSTTTPTDGEKMQFSFLDNGTARTLTWGTGYVAKAGVALPSTTVLSKNMSLGFEYNSNLSKWNLLALGQEA